MMKYALYEYTPKRGWRRSSFEQIDTCRRILDFKDGRNYAKRWAAHEMARCLQAVDLSDIIVMCIPASCHHTYTRRFKRFTNEFCRLTRAIDGFSFVQIHASRQKKHLSEDRSHICLMQSCEIDPRIRGRKVLVIDDICTTCSSANEFIIGLQAAGAEVVGAMFLAKTRTSRS